MFGETTSRETERVAKEIVDAAYVFHRRLGPGLLESVYEACLAYELTKRGLKVLRQVKVPIRYDDLHFDEAFRADLFVEDRVIVENKAVVDVIPVFMQQARSHVILMGLELGFLINFTVALIKDGIHRIVNTQRNE